MAVKISKKQTSRDTAPEIAGAVKMGIENAPESLIVEALTNMYSNPLSSAIRETVSNAVDASRESGTNLPVIVKLNKDELSVLDAGIGMNEQEITEVFLQYGASSKSKNIDATGAFGFGAKSPLAYNGEMVVSSVSGGVGIEATISNASGTPYARVESKEVCLPAGYATKITFPIKPDDYNEAEEAIAGLVSYGNAFGEIAIEYDLNDFGVQNRSWHKTRTSGTLSRKFRKVVLCEVEAEKPDGTIISIPVYAEDGSNPDWIIQNLLTARGKILDGKGDTAREFLCRSMSPAFVINGALYYFDGSNAAYSSSSPSIIIPVPSAALSFVPSREAIILDEKSNSMIEAVLDEIEKTILNKEKMASVATDFAALEGVNQFSFLCSVAEKAVMTKGAAYDMRKWLEALEDAFDCSKFKILGRPVNEFAGSQRALFFNVEHRGHGEMKNSKTLIPISAKSFNRYSKDIEYSSTTFDGFDDFSSCAEFWGVSALTAMMELHRYLFPRYRTPKFVVIDSAAIPPKKLRYELKKVDAKVFEKKELKNKEVIVNVVVDNVEQVVAWLSAVCDQDDESEDSTDTVVGVTVERYLEIKEQEKTELALLKALKKQGEKDGVETNKIATSFEPFVNASYIFKKDEYGTFRNANRKVRSDNTLVPGAEDFAKAIIEGHVVVVKFIDKNTCDASVLPDMLSSLGLLQDSVEYVVMAPEKNCTSARVKVLLDNGCSVYGAPTFGDKAEGATDAKGLPVIEGLGMNRGKLFLRRGFCQNFDEYCRRLANAQFVKTKLSDGWSRFLATENYIADCYALTFGEVDLFGDEFKAIDNHPVFSTFSKYDGNQDRVCTITDEMEIAQGKFMAAKMIWDACLSKYGMQNEVIAGGDRFQGKGVGKNLRGLADKKMELGEMIGAKAVFDAYLNGVSLDDLMEAMAN